jgi:DNA-dependent protein kinase catalytic subunit
MKEIPTAAEKKQAIDVAYQFFTNERDYPLEGRRAAAERVCLTLMRSCDEVALREFFLDHVGEIMTVIEANLSESTMESQLVCKLCCFNFMEVLYTRLPSGALSSPDSKINKAYCKDNSKTGKEMTQAVTKVGHLAKGEDLHGDRTLCELRRQYHCAAFNMVAAVISCTQKDLKFYTTFLFREDRAKGLYLWDNLVDPGKVYQFEIELESPIDRKKQLTAIRDERKSSDSAESSPLGSPLFPPRYLSSQYLADSSLSTDVSQFDFSGGPQVFPVIPVASRSENEEMSYTVSEEQIEQDELNMHECMLPLMRLIDHMQHNKITPEVAEGSTPEDMPSWMANIQKKLLDTRTQLNVQLLLTRLITHRPKVFQPYAMFWLPCLMDLVLKWRHTVEGLQYFVVDVVVTLLSWGPTAIPEDGDSASRLLEYLMQKCHHDNRSVFRNNLEIIKTLLELWREKLQAPTKVIYNHFCSPSVDAKSNRTGIQLLGVVVANRLPPYDPSSADTISEQKFYTTFVSLMSHKYKELYAAAAEVLGMILAFLDEKKHVSFDSVRELVVNQLLALCGGGSEDKFLICLNKIQINFSKLVDRFVEKLLFMLPAFHGVFRSMCLEVLLSQADIRPTLYQELKDKGFHDMLKFKDEPTQLAALNVCQGMLHLLKQEQVAELLPLLRAFGHHASQKCRVLMYDILIWIYNNTGSADESLKTFTSDVREQLLHGLADDADEIRMKMFDFWNQESRLASNTLGRLTQLLPVLYSTGTEKHFLYHSTNLLLELTSRSPDYNRSMFDQPLSECKFEEYKGIDLSWQQRYSQMTPLFAASLSSQTGQTQTDSGTLPSLAPGALRATQKSADFTPTQDVGGYNWMAPSAQSQDPSSFNVGSGETQSSSLLFNLMKPPKRPLRAVTPGDGFGVGRLGVDETDSGKDSKELQRMEIMKLKRRFLKDRKMTSAFFAKTQTRQKIMREENRKRQKAARNSKVVMYRKYRVGELPDTQIKYSEIIRPFQALAQRDSNLARMLFSSLYRSLFATVDTELTEHEAERTIKAIKDGLNAVLESSTDCCAPFIGSLHDVCFHERQLALQPTAVSTACLLSMQQPVGIMVLEKQLLVNKEITSSAKRARTTASDLTTTTWVEMSRLYKSLGDYDTLRGIFSSQVGVKSITQEALAAEERADYVEALRLYREAVGCESWSDGHPNQVEEDLWDDSMLECYSHLTEWQDLEKAVMVNIDDTSGRPKLDKIWEDAYHQEHYLPHLMRAKIKLACSGVDDIHFTDFLNNSLKDTERKDLLESRYCTELALYSIIRDDLDKAKYYNDNSLQLFLHDWSNLDVLLVKSRSTRLQDLQLLSEIQEFLEFMINPANFESVNPVYHLLSKWESRFPHPKQDPLSVWDNIVTSRCMMMRKLLERFRGSPSSTDGGLGDSMEVDGGSVNLTLLQERFSLEYTKLYMKIAAVARQHSNYAVCRKYLGLTETAVKKFFPGDSKLRLGWLHGVAEMGIQQAKQDPSPTKIEPLVALLDRLESAGKDSLTDDHTWSRKHHLLEGHAFEVLAKAFNEDGELIMNVLQEARVIQLNKLIGLAPTTQPSSEEITHKLLLKSLSSLKAATKSGTAEMKETGQADGMVEALMDMALFCDHALRADEDRHEDRQQSLDTEEIDGQQSPLDTDQFPSVVVMYSLKAMRHGCKVAVQRFPRLLQILELYPATTTDFKKKCSEVPHWMFIDWISQMLPLMDKPEGEAVEGILHSIAVDYPQAICYPFKISTNDFQCADTAEGKKRLEAINKLKACLENRLVDDFVTALEQLNSPELAWKDMLETDLQPLMEQSVRGRDKKRIKDVWAQIFAQLLDYKSWDSGPTSSLYGTQSTASLQAGQRIKKFAKENIKDVEKRFGGRDAGKLVQMTTKDFAAATRELNDGMRNKLSKSQGAGLLKEFSPWLHGFQANSYTETLEVPGQYSGKSEPLPEYHVKIAGFDEKVLIMSSMRKPKRLVIRGDDEREHMFLVKAGEDLRMDQRMEELFEVMNGILMEDPACSQRGLSLKTYQVIPMTPRIGMIEWVQNTKPLKDFMQSALTDDEKKSYANAGKWQVQWMQKYKKYYPTMYKEASRTEVEKEYRKKAQAAPWDTLRRAFFKLSSSPEAFLTLRSHFVRTHATLSVCHYVLGIGDRHLSNFMVDLESGGAVGIDFGHAFGTATQFLLYPELMPFRLTPQITNLLLPHSESGQLRSCMTHVLRALRNCPDLLLCTMDIFVKEPLLDWKSNARKQAKAQKLDTETFSQEGSWYPKEKLKQAGKKLLGYNPAHIMRTDLKRGHESAPMYGALERILMGDKKYSKRARVGERCCSVEEQMACLIDHATDPNILGRTWQGWEPWV